LLSSARRLTQSYKDALDWARAPALGSEIFTSSTTYDALNRPLTVTGPDGSVVRPSYNEANLLEQLAVNLRGAATVTPFVNNIDYDAKGRRVLIVYGSSVRPDLVKTEYAYDPDTLRLMHLTTTRQGFALGDSLVQDLFYAYDPVGNITQIADAAQQT